MIGAAARHDIDSPRSHGARADRARMVAPAACIARVFCRLDGECTERIREIVAVRALMVARGIFPDINQFIRRGLRQAIFGIGFSDPGPPRRRTTAA